MSICVISPKRTSKSARKLATALGGSYINPYQDDKTNFTSFDVLINYGTTRFFTANQVVNKASAVAKCVDKHKTLYNLARVGIPVVQFAAEKQDIPASWQRIVVRYDKTSNGAKSLDYIDKGETIPEAQFYTEYFKHKFEFRIVVLAGKVVGRYLKKENTNNEWEFQSVAAKGFELIDKACINAAAVLGIDFVGFDVLSNNEEDFRIIEANSGPIITDEVIDKFKELYNVA